MRCARSLSLTRSRMRLDRNMACVRIDSRTKVNKGDTRKLVPSSMHDGTRRTRADRPWPWPGFRIASADVRMIGASC